MASAQSHSPEGLGRVCGVLATRSTHSRSTLEHMPGPCVRVVSVPRLMRSSAEVAGICCHLETDPTGHDLVLDFCQVEVLEIGAAQQIRDHVFWRIHWSRVGCVARGEIARTLVSLHIDRVATIGEHLADVLSRVALDQRALPGGRRLLMGPGPAIA